MILNTRCIYHYPPLSVNPSHITPLFPHSLFSAIHSFQFAPFKERTSHHQCLLVSFVSHGPFFFVFQPPWWDHRSGWVDGSTGERQRGVMLKTSFQFLPSHDCFISILFYFKGSNFTLGLTSQEPMEHTSARFPPTVPSVSVTHCFHTLQILTAVANRVLTSNTSQSETLLNIDSFF